MALLSMENNSDCLCFGCGSRILDKFLLRVSPNLQWHAHCLKCTECGLQLDEKCTCFVRNGKPFCKPDYVRLFGNAKCCKCKQNLTKCDYVMRAQSKVFHVHCFRCDACSRHLVPGEHYAIKDETLYCKSDYEQQVISIELSSGNSENNFNKSNCRAGTPMSGICTPAPPGTQGFGGLVSGLMAATGDTGGMINTDLNNSSNCSSVSPNSNSNSSSGEFSNGTSRLTNNLNHLSNQGHLSNLGQVINDGQNNLSLTNGQSLGCIGQSNNNQNNGSGQALLQNQSHQLQNSVQINSNNGGNRHSNRNPDQPKQTRIRTVLNDRQLQTLKSVYSQNPRPDAMMKEQLVHNTGLTSRVIRVWFQNKRCKDKKKNILMKQMQQQERDGNQMQNIASMKGIPMIAMSPVPHGSPVQPYCSQVQIYEPNWAKFADCAAQGPCDSSDQHFQHLVNQMHGYDQRNGNTSGLGTNMISMNNNGTLDYKDYKDTMTPIQNDTKAGIQMISSTEGSSNGSVMMNGSSNSNTSGNSIPTLINPLINSGNSSNLINPLTTFDHQDLRRPESVLSGLRAETPSELSCTSD